MSDSTPALTKLAWRTDMAMTCAAVVRVGAGSAAVIITRISTVITVEFTTTLARSSLVASAPQYARTSLRSDGGVVGEVSSWVICRMWRSTSLSAARRYDSACAANHTRVS